MTAEIAILNKGGVALAADSAVTIGSGEKIYNTANKLFSLSKYKPVGVMIFGSADVNGYPWETIIKVYRNRLGNKSFDTVNDYSADFIKFIQESQIISSESQDRHFLAYVASYYSGIIDDIKEKIAEHISENGYIEEKQTKKITSEEINSHYKSWDEEENINGLDGDYCDLIIKDERKRINGVIQSVFQDLPLTLTNKKKLVKIAADLFCKKRISSVSSGIVFAGFGDIEIFPSLVSYRVDGLFRGILKYREAQAEKIDDDNRSAIIPFAQSEMVGTFMEGIDPDLKQTILGFMEKILYEIPHKFLNSVKLDKGQNKDKVKEQVDGLSEDLFSFFKDKISQYTNGNHVQPVMQAVSALPKDELAKMAESLVNITSFKRKITLDIESVGGPIDVAVISKGDGFVWVKRKHYFNAELNHSFFSNYFKEDPVEKSDGEK